MFPYIDTSNWHAGPIAIHPFGILVALGIATGFLIAHRRARLWGIPRVRVDEFCLWLIVAGLAGGHLLRFFYMPHPIDVIRRNPWILIQVFNGIASFGSMIGGVAAAAVFFIRRRVERVERWKYLDAVGFGLPFGWMLGRLGCALVHDHPGLRTTNWLGVRYPGGARFDLGLLEFLYLGVLGLLFIALARTPKIPGFFFGLFFLLYGPFRLALDQLHVDPPRYLGITLDQYSGIAALLGGAAFLFMIFREQRKPL